VPHEFFEALDVIDPSLHHVDLLLNIIAFSGYYASAVEAFMREPASPDPVVVSPD
jgi:hypothetical protein